MSFVDNADRLISTYKKDRKSKKWWHRLFWYFIDLTVTNSFIIFTKINNDNSVTLKKFKLLLVDQLVSHKLPTKKREKASICSCRFSRTPKCLLKRDDLNQLICQHTLRNQDDVRFVVQKAIKGELVGFATHATYHYRQTEIAS